MNKFTGELITDMRVHIKLNYHTFKELPLLTSLVSRGVTISILRKLAGCYISLDELESTE